MEFLWGIGGLVSLVGGEVVEGEFGDNFLCLMLSCVKNDLESCSLGILRRLWGIMIFFVFF